MIRYKLIDARVKDVDVKEGIISGYFSAFGNKDADGDVIHPGSFLRSIKDWGPQGKGRVKHLMNHNRDLPLGEIKELKEDNYGLYYVSKIGTHSLGVDFIKMVESNLVKEHSIGFEDLTPAERRKGEGFMNITDVKLWEGSSLTAWGANELTPVTGLKDIKSLIDRTADIEKFISTTDASDETICMCMEHVQKMNRLIEMMRSSLSATKAVDEPKVDTVDFNLIIENSILQWQQNFKMP